MKTRSLKLAFLLATLVLSPATTLDAQRGGGNRQGGGPPPDREQLEARFRMRLSTLLKTQLGLTDDGMKQLSDVNQKFDRQRRDVIRREMTTRRQIFDEVMKMDSANAGKIDQLIGEQFKIERERIDLTEAEQHELAKFLSPVQRAKYLGVQEQMRREMDQLRGRRGGGPPPYGDSTAFRRRRPPPVPEF